MQTIIIGSDDDKQKATEEKAFRMPSPYDVAVMLSPGFQNEIEFDVMPGMFFGAKMILPGQQIGPDDYEKAIHITVTKGHYTLVSMQWSIDATLELLREITAIFLASVPERAEEITKAVVEGLERIS